jgi:hypothetical protein
VLLLGRKVKWRRRRGNEDWKKEKEEGRNPQKKCKLKRLAAVVITGWLLLYVFVASTYVRTCGDPGMKK